MTIAYSPSGVSLSDFGQEMTTWTTWPSFATVPPPPACGSRCRTRAADRLRIPTRASVIAEYWPMSGDVAVVSIFSTDSVAALLELVFEWSDAFEIDISPAVSADEGLQIGPEVFGRLPRLQQ